MKMYEETRMFVNEWNATYGIKDFDERDDARDELKERYNINFGFTETEFRFLRMLSESIHRGNDTFVISETGMALDAENYIAFFNEHGIESFAYMNDSTAALNDMLVFMHNGWKVSGYTTVATRYDDEREAIVFTR